jgi:hypothetical protein
MIFPASFDRLVYWVTGGITLLFGMIIATQVAANLLGAHFIPLLTSLLLVSIYFFSFLLRVTGYELTGDYLVIRRFLKARAIPRSAIKEVEVLPKEALDSSFRIFGNGGLFGYYGKFTNRRIGTMTWYATRRDKVVLLRLQGGEKIIITPNEPQRLQQALKKERGTEVPL